MSPILPSDYEHGFRLFVESVKDYAIFMLDVDGHVETWNTGAERIKGYDAAEIIGRHFSAFYPPEDIATGKPQRALAASTKRARPVPGMPWSATRGCSSGWSKICSTAPASPPAS